MLTKEEKIHDMDFYRKWSKDFGEESMLEISCGMIQHLADKCKEYRQHIEELEANETLQ